MRKHWETIPAGAICTRTSAGRMRPGSAAATRTRVASCDSTSQGAAACAKAREALLKADHRLHTRPRKCLHYQTPAEVFNQALTGAFAI